MSAHRHIHSVGYEGGIECRVFDFFAGRPGVEVCEACLGMRGLHCESVRSAVERLYRRGALGVAKAAGRVTFYFVTRNAERPTDKRGRRKAC